MDLDPPGTGGSGGPATRATDIEALCEVEGIVAFELIGGGDEAWLRAEEETHLERAVPRRRREFIAGRLCARSALAALGIPDAPVLVGDSRQPIWPTGAFGSITHTGDYCLAVVGRRESTAVSVGVDAERIGRVGQDLFPQVLGPDERRRLGDMEPNTASRLATLVFGAKEAFYKAQFPVTGAWVDFGDVGVHVEGDDLLIDRVADLPAFVRLAWPIRARVLYRGEIAVIVVTVEVVA